MSQITHVLFDFFGTLVHYDQPNERAYPRTYRWLIDAGFRADYAQFVESWDGAFEAFHRRARQDLFEYSMDAVCQTFLERALGYAPGRELTAAYRDTYLADWDSGIRYDERVRELLADLSTRYVLALVTNTCHAPVVRKHLGAMGITDRFAAIVTSIEHGKRKPSPCIFERALELSSGTAECAVHVGDSFDADYRGALGAGLSCMLIDPNQSYPVPAAHRIPGVLDLRQRLLV